MHSKDESHGTFQLKLSLSSASCNVQLITCMDDRNLERHGFFYISVVPLIERRERHVAFFAVAP